MSFKFGGSKFVVAELSPWKRCQLREKSNMKNQDKQSYVYKDGTKNSRVHNNYFALKSD
jgi:hypothetical protein